MSPDTPAQVNALLGRFYTAEGAEEESILATLVEYARPRVRARLAGRGVAGEDLEDLSSVACLQLLEALRRSRAPGAQRIQDYASYVRRVANHVLVDHLRRVRSRHQFRRQVIGLLDGRYGGDLFARWQILADWLGGLKQWRGQPFRSTAHYRVFCIDHAEFLQSGLADRNPAHLALPELMARFFRWIETPLECGELSDHLAALKGVRNPVSISIDAVLEEEEAEVDHLLPPAPDEVAAQVLAALAGEQTRARLWQEVCDLPAPQRAALLLGLEWSELLFLAGDGSEIAKALRFPLHDLPALARHLPLTDKAIAARLGATEQQVSNLRKCARERLARRKERWQV